MKLIFPFALLLLTLSITAQNLSEQDVPEVVQKSFSRKFPRAENVSWNQVGENYKVDCFYRGRANYGEFTPEGEWVVTVTDLDTKTLYAPIQRYLDENFKRDKVILAEKAVKADRQNYYYVQVEIKDKETKEAHIVELFFDKTGRIEQAKLPESINDMTIVGIMDPNSEVPPDVIDSWKKRFPRAEEIDWSKKRHPSDTIDQVFVASFLYRDRPTKAEFLPNGDWVETRAQYDEKDLYTPVVRYLEENHWYDDLIIAEKVTRADRQDYYYVKMERMEKGQFRPYVFELFFSKSGKIQEVRRPEVLKSQYLLTVDIPPLVARKFKGRFASARDVTWETKKGNYVASFTYRDMSTTAEFTDSAAWVQTVSQMDIKSLYRPIQRILDNEYRDYRPVYAEKVTRQDRDNYYYVELVGKKKDADPHKLGLFFDKTGRLKED
jgi:hypothetical protein